MTPTAPEHFAVKAVVAAVTLILAMTAQALPLSYLIELERAKIEPAAKLFQQECGDNTDSQACKEQSQPLILRGEQSGLLPHTGMTEDALLCTPTKS